MKKVLFVVPNLLHGGSNKCLENIIGLIGKEALDVNVISYELINDKLPYYSIFKDFLVRMPFIYTFASKHTVIRKTLNAIKNYLHIDLWQAIYKQSARQLQKKNNFDVVVGFQESYATHFASYFPCKKVAWVHCDYDDYKVRSNNLDELRWYKNIDKIVCVSQYTKEVFVKSYESLRSRTISIYNPLDSVSIIKSSTLFEVSEFKSAFNIVSIGRFAAVKQFHLIPDVVRKMVSMNNQLDFCWYIIGDGDDYLMDETRKKIHDYDLQDKVILLGAKNNPYPYIAKAQLLVSTSYSEACPYVVNEGKILHTPIVCNNYPTAIEMIEPGKTGYVTSLDNMHELLINLIEDKKDLYSTVVDSLKSYACGNSLIIRQILKCINR